MDYRHVYCPDCGDTTFAREDSTRYCSVHYIPMIPYYEYLKVKGNGKKNVR